MYQIKIDYFEGPLDLLLKLIENQELDISKVSLADVTEQYLEFLKQIEQRQPDELADFLVIAAKLIYLKSKILLPSLELIEEEDDIDLAKQLRLYKKFIQAAELMDVRLKEKNFSFAREKLICGQNIIFNPPSSVGPEKLRQVFCTIIENIRPVLKLPQKSLQRTISIKNKIDQIRQLISDNITLKFSELVGQSNTRSEVVITFLGILELVKQRFITINQDYIFGEMTIDRFEGGD